MKIRILGCGGSFGSPLAWKRHGNIDLSNKKNFRTRSSILISYKDTNLLIDTSPDLRQQLYDAKCTNIDAVLYTHIHSDHTSGLPDMRAISLINDKMIPAYMPKDMQDEIYSKYKYIFQGDKDYSPFMEIKDLLNKFSINDFDIETFKHNHGSIDAQTFKIDKFAYSTDIKKFYDNDLDKLKNLDLCKNTILYLLSLQIPGNRESILKHDFKASNLISSAGTVVKNIEVPNLSTLKVAIASIFFP